jgi:hypothetical protein
MDLYERIRGTRAPVEVRERVFEAIARVRWEGARGVDPAYRRTRSRTRGSEPRAGYGSPGPASAFQLRQLGAWPAAVVAAVLTVGLLHGSPSTSGFSSDAPDMFVEDYLRRAVGQDRIDTDDPGEVRRFLERELGLRFDPIRIAGMDLSRAEICLLEGRRGAMIVYRVDGAEISHYVVPRERARARPPAVSTRDNGPGAEMPVITWATSSVEQALVGGVSAERLLAIAGAGASDD